MFAPLFSCRGAERFLRLASRMSGSFYRDGLIVLPVAKVEDSPHTWPSGVGGFDDDGDAVEQSASLRLRFDSWEEVKSSVAERNWSMSGLDKIK